MKQLLLVNDDKHVLDRTAVMLEALGWEVYLATDEKFVFESCVVRRPSLLIVDIEMASGEGFECIGTARGLYPNLFVVAVTRGGDDEIWPQAVEICGANRYIVGPVSSAQLSEAIDSGIEEGLLDT